MGDGLLFVLFIAAVFEAARRNGWRAGRIVSALIASVVPFGTFVLDRRLREDLQGAAARPRS
jgi:integral membrane protein